MQTSCFSGAAPVVQLVAHVPSCSPVADTPTARAGGPAAAELPAAAGCCCSRVLLADAAACHARRRWWRPPTRRLASTRRRARSRTCLQPASSTPPRHDLGPCFISDSCSAVPSEDLFAAAPLIPPRRGPALSPCHPTCIRAAVTPSSVAMFCGVAPQKASTSAKWACDDAPVHRARSYICVSALQSCRGTRCHGSLKPCWMPDPCLRCYCPGGPVCPGERRQRGPDVPDVRRGEAQAQCLSEGQLLRCSCAATAAPPPDGLSTDQHRRGCAVLAAQSSPGATSRPGSQHAPHNDVELLAPSGEANLSGTSEYISVCVRQVVTDIPEPEPVGAPQGADAMGGY
jgi:hypothetical protein